MSGVLETLVLGGTGLMGRPCTRELLARGHRVTVFSRGGDAARDGALAPDALERVEWLSGDRGDPASLAGALEGRRFDFTVDFLAFDATDIERLLLVPYAALGRYVMISSGQVYLVTEGATPPYREEDSDRPLIPEPPADSADHAEWRYGVGKRRAESAVAMLRATHGVRATVLRLPIVQGEGDRTLRLWAWLERMLDGGPVLLPEGARRPVRFLYAGDLARAVAHLAEAEAPRSGIYNLAQPDTSTLRELLERVAHAAGASPRFVEASWEELDRAGVGRGSAPYAGRWCSLLDPARAAAEWGFLPQRTDEYLPQVVRWHLEHRPATRHPGYATRARELSLAARLEAVAR